MRSSSLPSRSRSRSFSRVRSTLSLGSGVRRHQQIEQALFGIDFGAIRHFVQPLFAHHVDRDIHQVANHRLHVAAHVSHFGELAGLHLEERRVGQARQPARQFGLAHARGADHEDVLGHHLFGHLGRQFLAADAIAQRDRHGALRLRLPHYVLVQFANDLARSQLVQQRLLVHIGPGKIDHHAIRAPRRSHSDWYRCRCRRRSSWILPRSGAPTAWCCAAAR